MKFNIEIRTKRIETTYETIEADSEDDAWDKATSAYEHRLNDGYGGAVYTEVQNVEVEEDEE
jgi:hypothetical protein